MGNKELLYGLIGFFLGGLLVAIAANTFNNDELQREPRQTSEVRDVRGTPLTQLNFSLLQDTYRYDLSK